LKGATHATELAEKLLHALAYSEDGQRLVGAGEGGLIHTWSAANGAALETLQNPGAAVQALVCDAQGGLVSGASDGGLFVWDLDPSWDLERVIGSPDNPSDFVDRVTALDFSPDGLLLAAGSGEPSRGGELKILRVEDGSVVHNLPTAHSDTIFAVEFSPSGKFVASGGADKFLKVFAVDSGDLVRSFEGHTHHVLGVSWKAESKVVASSGGDAVIKVWDVETGDQLRTIQGFGKQVTALQFISFSPNTIACSGDASVRQHNTDDGKQNRNFEGSANYLYAVDVSADGRIVASGGYASVLRIWDAESGKVLLTFEASAKP
jgi:WD40 repeat protein